MTLRPDVKRLLDAEAAGEIEIDDDGTVYEVRSGDPMTPEQQRKFCEEHGHIYQTGVGRCTVCGHKFRVPNVTAAVDAATAAIEQLGVTAEEVADKIDRMGR